MGEIISPVQQRLLDETARGAVTVAVKDAVLRERARLQQAIVTHMAEFENGLSFGDKLTLGMKITKLRLALIQATTGEERNKQ